MRNRLSLTAFVVGVFVVALVIVGCGSSSSSSDSGSTSASSGSSSEGSSTETSLELGGPAPVKVGGEPIKIAFFINGTSNAYAKALEHGGEEEAKKLGLDLTTFDANIDAETQVNQMESALSGDYNAWAFQSVDESTCSLIKKAIEQGILISIFSEQVCTPADAEGVEAYLPGTLNFVAGDETTAAFTNWLGQIKKENPGPQDVLVVVGTQGLHQTTVTTEAAEALTAEDPEFKTTVLSIPTYDLAGAESAVEARLTADKDVTIIAGNYSDMTQGAALAVKRVGASGIKMYDMGGSEWAIEAIKDGTLQMTSPFIPKTESAVSIKSLAEAWEGNRGPKYIDITKTLKTGPFITKENVNSFTPQY